MSESKTEVASVIASANTSAVSAVMRNIRWEGNL